MPAAAAAAAPAAAGGLGMAAAAAVAPRLPSVAAGRSPPAPAALDQAVVRDSTSPQVIGFVVGMIALLAVTCAVIVAMLCMLRKLCGAKQQTPPPPPPPGQRQRPTQITKDEESASFHTFNSTAATVAGGRPAISHTSNPANARTQHGGAAAARQAAVVYGMDSRAASAHAADPRGTNTAISSGNPAVPAALVRGHAPNVHDEARARADRSVAASRSSAGAAVQEDDMDGISVVELDETAGERSDGAETLGGSQVIVTEYLRSRNTPQPASSAQPLGIKPGGANSGGYIDMDAQPSHDGAPEPELFMSDSSVISLERTANYKA